MRRSLNYWNTLKSVSDYNETMKGKLHFPRYQKCHNGGQQAWRCREKEAIAKRERSSGQRSHRQSEVVLVLALDGQCKVLITGLRKAVLFIQNVQDSHQLCLHKI